jgi:hypothetical protein
MKISVGDKVWFIWCNLAVLAELGAFIVKTHGLGVEETQKRVSELMSNCKEKLYCKDWFVLFSHDDELG